MAEESAAVATPPSRVSLARTLVRSAAHFSLATVAAQATGLVRSYYIGRALGPGAAGLWIGLQLVVSYGANLHLGAIYGMHRSVPLLRGRNDLAGIRDSERTTLTFTLLAGVGCFLLVGAATFGLLAPLGSLLGERARELLAHVQEPEMRPVVLGLGAVLPANLLRAYYVTLFKAHNRFREASRASLIGSAVGVLTVPLIPLYGLAGVVWGLLALILAEVACLVALQGLGPFGLRWSVLREHVAFGLVAVATSVMATLLASIDRTVLLEHFPAEVRGQYYPAVLVSAFFTGLASVPNAILYPRLTERYGQTGRSGDLVGLVDRTLRLVTALLAAVAGAGAIAMPLVLRVVLPGFLPGTAAAQVAIGGIACSMMVGVVINVYYALDRQWLFLAICAAGAAASYGVTELAVRLRPGLLAVATGTTAGYVMYVVPVVLIAWWLMEQPLREGLRALARVLLPLAWAALCAAALIAGTARLAGPGTVLGTLAGEAVFALLFGPLLLASVRRARRPG